MRGEQCNWRGHTAADFADDQAMPWLAWEDDARIISVTVPPNPRNPLEPLVYFELDARFAPELLRILPRRRVQCIVAGDFPPPVQGTIPNSAQVKVGAARLRELSNYYAAAINSQHEQERTESFAAVWNSYFDSRLN